MKVAILYDVIFPYSIGGGEKINWEVARRLAARGHDVYLVSSKMWEGESEMDRDGVHYVGVCRWLATSNNLGNRSSLQPFLFAASAFTYLRKNKFDVVACNAFPYLSCLTAKLAGWLNSAPLVITWYEARGFHAWRSYAGIFYGIFASILEKWTAGLTSHHNTISHYTAERMEKILAIPKQNITVIPCGVDLVDVQPKAPVTKEKTILYAGRVVRHKRVDLLIEAFAELAKEFPDYHVKIIGPGTEKPALQAKVRTLDLENQIRFFDTMVGKSLYDEFRKASLFVLPSDQEGFGMVLIEAMAAETPVIAKIAELSAASTVIQHGVNGLLFTSKDELCASIRQVLTDENLRARLVIGGKETAGQYDWESVIIPAMEEYLEAVPRPSQYNGSSTPTHLQA